MISFRDHEELLHHILKTMVQEHLRYKSLTDPQYRLRASRQTGDVDLPSQELDLDIDEFEIKVKFCFRFVSSVIANRWFRLVN